MLFQLDDSLAGLFTGQQAPPPKVLDGISLLAHSRRTGCHLVVGSRGVLSALAATAHLGSRDRAVFQHLLSRFSTISPLRSFPAVYIEVVPSQVKPISILRGGQVAIQMPIEALDSIPFVGPTVLLGENIDDANLMAIVGESWLHHKGVSGIAIRCSTRGGGGSTLEHEFGAIVDQGDLLCLCVADSDKSWPNAPQGATARAVLSRKRLDRPYCAVLVLDIHEIENMLPVDVIESAWRLNNAPHAMSALISDGRDHQDSFIIYFDFKNGIRSRKFASDGYARYWIETIDRWRQAIPNLVVGCSNPGICGAAGDCTCRIVPGYGAAILSIVLNNFRAELRSSLTRGQLSASQMSQWVACAEAVASWCCGSLPMRVV